jgi:hypothetical protein
MPRSSLIRSKLRGLFIVIILSAVLIHFSSLGRYSRNMGYVFGTPPLDPLSTMTTYYPTSNNNNSSNAPTNIGRSISNFKATEAYYINLDKNKGRRDNMEKWLSDQEKGGGGRKCIDEDGGDDDQKHCTANDVGGLSYQRVPALRGDPNSCPTNTTACAGVSGLALTVVNLIDSILEVVNATNSHNDNDYTNETSATGATGVGSSSRRLRAYPGDDSVYVLEDDYYLNFSVANDFVSRYVPDDWEIVRFNPWLWDPIPPSFRRVNEHVVRSSHEGRSCENDINSTTAATTTTKLTTARGGGDGDNNAISDQQQQQKKKKEPQCKFCGGTHAMLWRISALTKLRDLWSERPYRAIDCRLNTDSVIGYLLFLDKPISQHKGNSKFFFFECICRDMLILSYLHVLFVDCA